jgi:pilus assembly protein CpaC
MEHFVKLDSEKGENRFRSITAVALLGFTCCFGITAAVGQQAPVAQNPSATQNSHALAPGAAEGDQGPEVLHIVVGHSLLIRSQARIKRILTGNPLAIESVPTSPYEVVVTAKQAGSSSLLMWDETGKNRMLDIFADVDINALQNALQQAYPNGGVDVQSQEGRVVLVGTVPTTAVADQMVKMAGNFSKEVVNGLQIALPPRQKQIILKVRFAEADRNKLSEFGINLISTGATNTIGTVSTQQFGPATLSQQGTSGTGTSQFNLSDLLNIFLFRPDINLGATIKDLQQKQVLQILAEPNLMAISGQPAHFLAGGEFPYPVAQYGAGGVGASITIMFKPYGVKLEFTGVIQDDGTIRLKVAPEVSSLDYTNTVTISGFVMPAIQTRRAETEIELKDGQSFGIAGLLDERTTVQLSKVPGIADIPILGELFKSRSINRTNSELIVLVTPSIVDPVAGEGLSPAEHVDMPVRSLDKNTFDKNLPYANKTPGAQ